MGWALDNLPADARDRIARTCFVVESHGGDWLNRLALPIRDEKGALWNIRVYYPFSEDIPEGGVKIISWGKGHGHARLFPSLASLRPEGPILLVEGEPDAIYALSQGMINVFAQTSKTNHIPNGVLQRFSGRDVHIAYDADKPGQEYPLRPAPFLFPKKSA